MTATQTDKPIGADGIAKVAAASLLGITESLAALGYRLEGGDKSWKAYPIAGGDPIGPAASPKALLTMVNLKAGPVEAKGNGKGKTVTAGKSKLEDGKFTESNGSPKDEFLFEEMKPVPQTDVPELRQPILSYQDYKERRMELTKLEVESKAIVDKLMHDHQDELAVDPKTGVKSYQVEDVVIDLIPGEDTLKSRRVADED